MTTVVTGAGGLTGGEIARRLIARGDRVITISRHAAGVVGATDIIGDCGDPAVMERPLAEADTLIHVAGILEGSRVARLSALRGVRRVVVVSSAGVYSKHRASAAAYLEGERAIANASPTALFLRPTMIYGSARDRNIHHVIRAAERFGILPQIGPGDARLQPIHYEDLAAATVAVVGTERSGTLDAGGGTAIPLAALLREIFNALGRSPRIVQLPAGPALRVAGMIDRVRGSRWAERIARMAEERTVDIAALVTATGTHPRSFAEGVRFEIAAMRQDGSLRR